MKYDFTTIVDRTGTGASKINPAKVRTVLGQNYYDDTISMWIADMDLACSPHIIERLKQRADRLIFGYTMPTDEYFSSVVNWYKRRQNVSLESNSIVYCNGALNAVANIISCFTSENDGIILQGPVYFPFYSKIQEANRRVLDNRLLKDENGVYSLDFEDFEAKCKQASMFILCNPHNPIGTIWSKDEVKKLIDIATANNVLVMVDEVHSDIIRCDQSYTSALTLDNLDNTIVVTGINKTFNLPGLQGSNLMFRNPKLQEKYLASFPPMSINPFTMEATIAAYDQSEEWVNQLNQTLDENMHTLEDFLKEKLPKIRFHLPAGTYLAWLDFTAYGLTEPELMDKLSNEAHLALEGGAMFGETGYIRMNVACSNQVLKNALDRLFKTFG